MHFNLNFCDKSQFRMAGFLGRRTGGPRREIHARASKDAVWLPYNQGGESKIALTYYQLSFFTAFIRLMQNVTSKELAQELASAIKCK